MGQIISDSSFPHMGEDFASSQQVTDEWIQSLSPELKDSALLRFCKIVEAKPTLVESIALSQVLYRTISGGTFTESADSAAKRTGHDRKTILKGLDQAVSQNILKENKRPGTSTEYSFKPVEEWKPEPERVVRTADTPRHKGYNVIQFPPTEELPAAEVVHIKDYPQTDTNNHVVVNKLLNKQQLVNVPILDTPTIWRSLPDGNRYAQIPPIHDQETGVEIQRQMEQEGLTAQSVVKRAIAFSKVPLLVSEALASVGSRLLNACSQTVSKLTENQNKPSNEDVEVAVSLQLSKTLMEMGVILTNEQMHHCLTEYGEDAMLDAAVQLRKTGEIATQEDKEGYFLNNLHNTVRSVVVKAVTPKKPGITAIKSVATGGAAIFPTEIMQMLKNGDIHLVPAKAEKLWAAYSEKFVDAIAYVDQKTKEGKVANREGYFVKCLEEGWLVKKPEPEKRDPHTLTLEQQQWYDWACMTGICINTSVKDLPTKMGVLAVLIPIKNRRPFDPPYDLVAINVAMQEYLM
ncbi:MAG: hypothetical protein PUP91_37795 [Rhizonema sp. PD37]|nr:hypothetical protein [Rhizonema sp. PD37]